MALLKLGSDKMLLNELHLHFRRNIPMALLKLSSTLFTSAGFLFYFRRNIPMALLKLFKSLKFGIDGVHFRRNIPMALLKLLNAPIFLGQCCQVQISVGIFLWPY